MNTDQTPAQTPCTCSPEELAWCLRWMQEHGDPCEWNEAAEAEYKKAHDAVWAVAS